MNVVLVLEDDSVSGMLIQTILEEAGFEAHLYSNGGEALKILPTLKPTILISDWSLDGSVSAAQVARELRRISPTAKIVFTTGYEREDLGESLHDLEPLTFLKKPVDYDQLVIQLPRLPAPKV